MSRAHDSFSNRHRTRLSVLLVVGGLSSVAATVSVAPFSVERLPDGNTLIADGMVGTGNDARVIEVDSLGRLIWAYVRCDVPFLHAARRLANGDILMASSFGNKVLEVNRNGDRVWLDSSGLNYPNDAYRLQNHHTLITDRNNNRVIEVDSIGTIVWSYANLNAPHNGNRIEATGHTLVCDSDSNRVVEVDTLGTVVWQYATGLGYPRCAVRLDSGHTLIGDTQNDRVIEVDSSGTIVWSANGLSRPYAAERLADGNTLVSTGAQVLELTPAGSVVWQYPNTVPVIVETLQVVNPSSGCTLYVHIHRPAYAGLVNRVPAVVYVPGGNGFGSQLDSTATPDDIASDGFAFLHFDPDGRGRSSAYPENYDGYVQQDGLHACLSLLASRDYVDTSRLGVYAHRYGITMGSGMIARYDEPRVKFLLDFEGPADRYQSCRDSGGHVPVPTSDDSFWQEREAVRFIKQFTGAYLRVQSAIDSNPRLSDNRHAIQLTDSATAFVYGGAGISAWTRVNDSVMNEPNRVYTWSDPPAWIPEEQEVQSYIRVLLYLHELADMDLSVAATDRHDLGPSAPLRASPRPCRGVLQVELPSGAGSRELQVHDACGRLVARAPVSAGRTQAALNLRGLQPGVYYVSTAGAAAVPVVVVR